MFDDLVEINSLSSDWLLYFYDLSAFTLIFAYGFLLLRPSRVLVTSGTQHGAATGVCELERPINACSSLSP